MVVDGGCSQMYSSQNCLCIQSKQFGVVAWFEKVVARKGWEILYTTRLQSGRITRKYWLLTLMRYCLGYTTKFGSVPSRAATANPLRTHDIATRPSRRARGTNLFIFSVCAPNTTLIAGVTNLVQIISHTETRITWLSEAVDWTWINRHIWRLRRERAWPNGLQHLHVLCISEAPVGDIELITAQLLPPKLSTRQFLAQII